MTRPAGDLIKELWTGTGSGSIVLDGGAVPGFQPFTAALNGEIVSYSVEHEDGTQRETVLGTYTHATKTLTRTFVTSPTFGGSPVAFTGGNKHVRLSALAVDVVENRATADPTSADDINAGYIAGRSRWLNTATGNVFFCTSHAPAAATWARVNIQSAAELLTAIKTVDGAASGLDADLLGGIASASYYRSGSTDVAVLDGGTGASDAPTARTNLGLAIGSQVQGFDALLQAIGQLALVADQYIYGTGTDTVALGTITAFARSLLDDADAATARTTLGAQAADADLTALAALTNPATTLTTALQPASLASGAITPRVGAINFAGGATGDVLSVQAGGGLAIAGPPLALTSFQSFGNDGVTGANPITPTATTGQNVVLLTGTLQGTLTATLPSASANPGKQLIFVRTGGGNFEFQAGSKNARKGEMIWLISDGSTWQSIDQRRPAQVRLTASSNVLDFGAHSHRKITLTAQTSPLTITLNDDYPTDTQFLLSIDPAPIARTITFSPGASNATIKAAILSPIIPPDQPYEFYIYVNQNPTGTAAEIHVYDRTSGTMIRENSLATNRTLGPADVNSQQRNTAVGGTTWTINRFIGSIFVDNYDGAVISLISGSPAVTLPDSSIAANKFATLIGRNGGTEVRVIEAP